MNKLTAQLVLKRFDRPDEVREMEMGRAAFADGRVVEMREGDLFYIPPESAANRTIIAFLRQSLR